MRHGLTPSAPPGAIQVGLFCVTFLTEHTVRLSLSVAFATVVALWAGHYVYTGFNAGIALLEEATRAQCAAQDWPSSQHQAHVDFCEMEGYPVGTASRK